MAPITATGMGMMPQIVDDERLTSFHSRLESFPANVPLRELERSYKKAEDVDVPLNIEELIRMIEPYQNRWPFEEQVDLNEWIRPMNLIDISLRYYIQTFPHILLVEPIARIKSPTTKSNSPPGTAPKKESDKDYVPQPAQSMKEVQQVPKYVTKNIVCLVQFLATLLGNSCNKAVFNSVDELIDLLAAADEDVATAALGALQQLSVAPTLHKQQAPDAHAHSSALHVARSVCQKRLMALSRGWGTRGSGLSLATCSTADDSEFGQGALPKQAGELCFEFFRKEQAEPDDSDAMQIEDEGESNAVVQILLDRKDISNEPLSKANEESLSGDSSKKRRRVARVTMGETSIRSTAELFFLSLEKAGGRSAIPEESMFPLLADIRLSRSFHCQTTRIAAVERRLSALICCLCSHPSQEILSGYYQAQPELIVELVDLLRPTVSSAVVSAASAADSSDAAFSQQNAFATLANSHGIPLNVRKLGLEALTALVSRRDGTHGALTGVAKHSNVLSELGVAKGQYLGLLPTLIRFSLASLGSYFSSNNKEKESTTNTPMLPEESSDDAIAFEVGLAFVEATTPPALPMEAQIQEALLFVESVLSLTSAVVATPTGTYALTECGLIPALLTTITNYFRQKESTDILQNAPPAVSSQIRFLIAQTVQILEGAIVTHNSALAAFHDLQGVEVLTKILSLEVLGKTTDEATPNDEMEVDGCQEGESRILCSSRRVLLFSLFACLAVVFHQESTSSTATTTPSGASELRKPLVCKSLMVILDNVERYGGHLTSMIAALLADVMNSDPHVVHHVHSSGLAASFLNMMMIPPGTNPRVPAVPELITSIPNVLAALSLTEDGAKAVKEKDPYPSFFRLLFHPNYVMPRSRSLLNEMTSLIGTGLDEIMRHVPSMKSLLCEAMANAMHKVAALGEELEFREAQNGLSSIQSVGPASDIENDRTCLMQYALNFGMILEQILHNQDHCEHFVEAGGLDAILKLYPFLIPTGVEFLAQISSLSCPSVSTLSHSTTEDSLTMAFKCVAMRHDPSKLLKVMIDATNFHLLKAERCHRALRTVFELEKANDLDSFSILDGLPTVPLTRVPEETVSKIYQATADYLRQLSVLQWTSSLLASSIKAACHRSNERGSWSRGEREWKQLLSSPSFAEMAQKLSIFHQSAICEVCRVRTSDDFDLRDKERLDPKKRTKTNFRLRIVCPEGAVLRDGIEIDSCANVGSVEMGEIVDAFDRCVNSSGVVRYHTGRGWVSEQTRGHGREPIAEVLNFWEPPSGSGNMDSQDAVLIKGRVEIGLPDMRTAAANILARLQISYTDLFSSLCRVLVQGIRTLPTRTIRFEQGSAGEHVAVMVRLLSKELQDGFNLERVSSVVQPALTSTSCGGLSPQGAAMYLGCMMSHLQACLFEEKRDRRSVNVPLLLVISRPAREPDEQKTKRLTFLDAVEFVCQESFKDSSSRAKSRVVSAETPWQRVGRTSASSFPPAIALLRRLVSGPSITSSPVASVLSRVSNKDLQKLLGSCDISSVSSLATGSNGNEQLFDPEKFARNMLCHVSKILLNMWRDPKLCCLPAHTLYPIVRVIGEVIRSLNDVCNKSSSGEAENQAEASTTTASDVQQNGRESSSADQAETDVIVPEDDTIQSLTRMGFSREHARISILGAGSNRVELAAEYALMHPGMHPMETSTENDDQESPAGSNELSARETTGRPDSPSRSENRNEDEKNMEKKEGKRISKKVPVVDKGVVDARYNYDCWIQEGPKKSCELLADIERICSKSKMDGDAEGGTVIMASFVMDFCQRCPDESTKVASALLQQIQVCFSGERGKYFVTPGKEDAVASLAHAALLLCRSVPKLRTLVLKAGLVSRFTASFDSVMTSTKSGNAVPPWMASALLLLDVLAQPVVAFAAKTLLGEVNSEDNVDDDFTEVINDHKEKSASLASLASDILSALNSSEKTEANVAPTEDSTDESRKKENDNSNKEGAASIAIPQPKKSSPGDSPWAAVPAYFPLLSTSQLHSCVQVCIKILDAQLSAGVLHAALQLLMRLLRSSKVATVCVQQGLVDKIIRLPRDRRFTGHSGLIMLILRRLVEDETVLQLAMETEIRGSIVKLSGNKPRNAPQKEKISVPRKSFLQATTPLLCRDPCVFLKAMAVSVEFGRDTSPSPQEDSVTLLSHEDRVKNLKKLAEIGRPATRSKAKEAKKAQRSTGGNSKKRTSLGDGRNKTSARHRRRSSTPKRTRKERQSVEENPPVTRSGAGYSMHVVLTLVQQILVQSSDEASTDFGYETSFLWVADLLDILADLVLTIPACATAIHKLRPRSKDHAGILVLLSSQVNALQDCPQPSKTFVSWLLHALLPQERWSCRNESYALKTDKTDGHGEAEKKKRACQRAKVAQGTARLLIALVARPGDGRRQVIAELAFALSGGRLGVASPIAVGKMLAPVKSNEMHPLLAWGELCIGLAAPRTSSSSDEGSSMISFEVIRLMLEHGMVHALLFAIQRVPLQQEMTTAVVGSLVSPLELLSRPLVSKAVRALVDKEAESKEQRLAKQTKPSDPDDEKKKSPTRNHPSFDRLLEDTFASQGPMPNNAIDESFVSQEQPSMESEDDEFVAGDVEDDMDADEEAGNDIDADEEMEDPSSDSSDEASSSDEDTSDSDSEESDADDSDDDSDEDGSGEDIETVMDDDEPYARDGTYGQETANEAFDGGEPMLNRNFAEENIAAVGESIRDWTRIESFGFGGTVLGSRGRAAGGDVSTNRGFIDVAEEMIGTLLRTGEIHGQALADIEGSLGIRIMSSRRGFPMDASRRGAIVGVRGGATEGDTITAGGDVLGMVPQVCQRSQPDWGYSSMGGGSRSNEISPMEYLFGGPSISAGSRNYDVVSPMQLPENEDGALSVVSDGQLFPGGPASATRPRTQHALHPLQCGVNLPPINALVSDLLPHELRTVTQGQMIARRVGDWPSLANSRGVLITSTGNLIRAPPRGSGQGLLSLTAAQRSATGPVGWTDDGVPFDDSVQQLSSGFEVALGASLSRVISHAASREEEIPSAAADVDDTQMDTDSPDDNQRNGGADGSSEAGNMSVDAPDGDVVASSLASNLRLSPTNDNAVDIPEQATESATNGATGNDNSETVEINNDTATAPPAAPTMGDNLPEHGLEQNPSANSGSSDRDIDTAVAQDSESNAGEEQSTSADANPEQLICPPGMDPDMFNSLPPDIQREVAEQTRVTAEIASQLDPGSSLDPEALVALPEEMRREAIEQERRERRLREEVPADPANAEEMDNASFVASLSPELRNEILMTADETFLQSLPANIVAEAQVLRERSMAYRNVVQNTLTSASTRPSTQANRAATGEQAENDAEDPPRRKLTGKILVEANKATAVFVPLGGPMALGAPMGSSDMKALIRLLFLLSPVRPHRLLEKVFQNFSCSSSLRRCFAATLVRLLHDDTDGARSAIETLKSEYGSHGDWRAKVDQSFEQSASDFPPSCLIGVAPEIMDTDGVSLSIAMLRRKQSNETIASMATSLPMSARGSRLEGGLPPVVAARIVHAMQQMCKNSPRFCLDMILLSVNPSENEDNKVTCFDMLLDLLEKPRYSKSATSLEDLLQLTELCVSPLSHLVKRSETDAELSERDITTAEQAGKEWADVPRIVVSKDRLKFLCSILRMETCREGAFTKVNTIARRLCRVEANRGFVLTELASVSRALGADAVRDLKSIGIRMAKAVHSTGEEEQSAPSKRLLSASSSVAVSTSTSEVKLLRVLQTLQALCADPSGETASRKHECSHVTEELVHLLGAMDLHNLWSELTACLKSVQLLEGVKMTEDPNKPLTDEEEDDDDANEDNGNENKKLQNSVAGLLTRFLPVIEAFFVANASATRPVDNDDKSKDASKLENLVDGAKTVEFVAANKVLLNALVRNNANLLDKGLRALIQIPRCRHILDFDVKAHWFKVQVRRITKQASRRHGSLRLQIRRKHVFEDAYHQLRLRNVDEMRGRLHVTFRNEEGVDAGGLSREFFGILAKEMFNPNYALFTSTEDGSTFQPNPNSTINPDHLSYFRFVGRIVGKAVADGYLLDAHFTRSLYKHMLGIKPTHHDMEAIDPDYYKNLKAILEYNLEDLGLDLTFSIENHSFGGSRTVDLIPDGRNVSVTEENKEKYVGMVCQHRMTTSISSQIRAYLDGFYELVSRDLVAIFTPRELELLISGLPDIDVHDLKKNTDYVGWKSTDSQIEWFWRVLFSLSRNEKAAFLQFVTGSSKVPLAGFGSLPGMRGVQKFSIHKAAGSTGALMSAHTCFNSLDLPSYNSEEELKEKLLYSIAEGGGSFLIA